MIFNPRYSKAWAAFIAGGTGIAAMFSPPIREQVDPETIQIASVLLSTATVWYFRNKEK